MQRRGKVLGQRCDLANAKDTDTIHVDPKDGSGEGASGLDVHMLWPGNVGVSGEESSYCGVIGDAGVDAIHVFPCDWREGAEGE